MTRPPTRTPFDLAAVTRDVKARCARAGGNLEQIARLSDPIFGDPRQVMLELILANHEVEAAISIVKKVWWP
jgi:hypothetical protein